MEDIARSMGKGKSTLYYYYCSKEEIFDAVISKEMTEVFHDAKEAAEKSVSAEDKLRAFTITKVKALQKKSNLYKVVRGEMQENMRCMKHLHTEYDQQEVKLVTDILSFGIKNGEFNPAIKKELDIMPLIIVSSLRGLEQDLFAGNKYPKLETRIDFVISIMVKGLKK
jgi:AcrR family transcriptional regulator